MAELWSPRKWEINFDPPVELTKLERAVIDKILAQLPRLNCHANSDLKVWSRDYTVTGLFTDFKKDWLEEIKPRTHKIESDFSVVITAEGIEHQGGALLFTLDDVLLGLEMYAYGSHFDENPIKFSVV